MENTYNIFIIYFKAIIIAGVCTLFTSCMNRYKSTRTICEKNLYVEDYGTPTGIDASYLTDSINFRIFIGQYDQNYNFFDYSCKGDSIIVETWDIEQDMSHPLDASKSSSKLVERKSYSLSQLKREKKYDYPWW